MNPRASLVLGVIAGEPRLNSREVAYRARMNDEGQASRLLTRLERLGLIANTRGPGMRAGKAWTLTAQGERVQEAIGREANAPEPASAFDLPPQFAGRLDDRAVLMLRVIADQPWLRGSEVAQRAGVHDDTLAKTLLDGLAGFSLAASEREPHGRGAPRVWRLTASGERLDEAIGRDAPPVPRSRTLDLMHDSGGRLSDTAQSVLRVIGAEPGLSNNEIAGASGSPTKTARPSSLRALPSASSSRTLATAARSTSGDSLSKARCSSERSGTRLQPPSNAASRSVSSVIAAAA